MSITDELREWARRYAYFKADLYAIADRIDAEHRAALEKVAAAADEPSPDAFDALMDGFKLGRKSDGFNTFIAYIHELEKRVSAIERKLNHRGER